MKPVRLAAERRLANGVIGAFRCVRSARYMKDDLLPVYVTDPQHIASPLLALVSYSEHERFEAVGACGHVNGAPGQGLTRRSE